MRLADTSHTRLSPHVDAERAALADKTDSEKARTGKDAGDQAGAAANVDPKKS